MAFEHFKKACASDTRLLPPCTGVGSPECMRGGYRELSNSHKSRFSSRRTRDAGEFPQGASFLYAGLRPATEFLFARTARILSQSLRTAYEFFKQNSRGFGLWEHSHDFLGAFLAFGNAPTAFPARFRALGAFPRLRQCVFGLQKHFRDFPDAFFVFKSIFAAFPARFWRSKVFSRLSLRNFGFWERSHGFLRSPCGLLTSFASKTRGFFGIKFSKK